MATVVEMEPSGAGRRIVVVEDDNAIASCLVRGLRDAGFTVDLALDGVAGAKLALESNPDLVVLDLMLPGQSGFETLEQLRSRSSVPVIVLTALSGLEERLRVFGLGADDYLAKPFWMEELVARVRVRLRVPEPANKLVIRWDNVMVDLDARTVTVGQEAVELTRHEFNVLAYLLERPGRAASRQALADAALPLGGERVDRTVDSHVARIRRKLGEAGARIHTVWGIGYRFDPPEK